MTQNSEQSLRKRLKKVVPEYSPKNQEEMEKDYPEIFLPEWETSAKGTAGVSKGLVNAF